MRIEREHGREGAVEFPDVMKIQCMYDSMFHSRLSEDNCIEVMSKLIGDKKIDVVFTRSGGAYVTRKHLRTEVRRRSLSD